MPKTIMACCVLTAYVMNRIIKACEILNLDLIKIEYNEFDDGPRSEDVANKDGGALMVSRFTIDGMTCSACVTAIESTLRPMRGVEAVSVSLTLSRASVAYYDELVSIPEIVAAVEEKGYTARLGERTAQQNLDLSQHQEALKRLRNAFGNAVTLSSLISAIDWIRGYIVQQPAPCTLLILTQIALGLWVQLIEAEWIHRRAWRKGSLLRPNMDTLISFSLILGLALSIIQTFMHGLDADGVYWASGSMLTAVIIGGRYIDTLLRKQTAQDIARIYSLQCETTGMKVYRRNVHAPSSSTLAPPNPKTHAKVPALLLQPGDEIWIDQGAMIACDCYITAGSSIINQASMTGESLPVARGVGDWLMSGTRNVGSELVATVAKAQEDSALEQLVSGISAATEAQSIEGPVDLLNSHFIRLLFLVAASCAFTNFYGAGGPANISSRIMNAAGRAMTILASACPCALGLAAPSAVMSGISVAMRRGIVIRGGASTITKLADLTHVVLDKTGTLTTGQLGVARISGTLDSVACMVICAAERVDALTHPVARTVFQWALQQLDDDERRDLHKLNLTEVHREPGKGVSCTIERPGLDPNVEVHLGTDKFFADHGISVPAEDSTGKPTSSGIVVHIAFAKSHSATLYLSDTIRTSAPDITSSLQTRFSLALTMLTGDSTSEAQRVSRILGIPVLSARALPSDKSTFIQKLRSSPQSGGIAMIGDGLNDAPALAAADVGILLSPGLSRATAAQTGVSDVILATGDLARILDLITIARETMRQVSWNRRWAIVYNVFAVGLAMGLGERWGIRIDPTTAGMLMVGSSISVVGWSLWFMKWLEAAVSHASDR